MVTFNYSPSETDLQKFFKNFDFNLPLQQTDLLIDRTAQGDYECKRWVTVEYDELPVFAFLLDESLVIDKDTPESEAAEKRSDTFIVFGSYYFLVTDGPDLESQYRDDLHQFLWANGLIDLLHLVYQTLMWHQTKYIQSCPVSSESDS